MRAAAIVKGHPQTDTSARLAAVGEPGGEPKLSIFDNLLPRVAAGLGFWGLWWEAMDVAGRWFGELLGGLVVLSLIGIAVAIARPAAQPPGDEQADHAPPWNEEHSPSLGTIEACFAGCWLIGALWLGWKLAWLVGDIAGVWVLRFVAPYAPTPFIALVGPIAGVFTFSTVLVIAHATGDVVIHAARAMRAKRLRWFSPR
jgi:hypothetical protein